MRYAVLADLLVVVHLAFVVFAVAGGLLVARWPTLAWAHLPAVAWAAWIELTGGICPLTPVEVALRVRAGQAGFPGDFVAHYLGPLIYPPGLTREHQAVLGFGVLALNGTAYALLVARHRRGRRRGGAV